MGERSPEMEAWARRAEAEARRDDRWAMATTILLIGVAAAILVAVLVMT